MMKLSKNLLVLAGLGLLVCTAAYFFRDRVLAPLLQRVIVHTVGTELGLEITVEKLSGNYFRDLRLTGLRTVKPAETGMLVTIGAATIHAHYSLPLLLKGLDAFLGNLRLELDGARVTLDLTRDWAGTGAEGASPEASFVLPVTRAHDAMVDLRGRDWALSLSGTDLTVEPFDDHQGGIPLTVHAAKAVLDLPAMHRQVLELGARGLLTRDSVRVAGLEVNGKQALEGARFDYAPGQPFSFALSFFAFGGSGKIDGVFADDVPQFGWDVREVDLSAAAALFVLAGPAPGGVVTSGGALAGAFADPSSLAGRVSLQVTDGSFRNIPFKHLALEGSAGEGVLRIDSFAAELGRNLVAADGVSVVLAPLVAGDMGKLAELTRGRFSVSLEDIPALLRLAGVKSPKDYLPGGIPAHRLVLAGRAASDGLTLESGTFSGGSATVTVERCAVTMPRTGPLLAGLGLSVKLTANIPDLGRTASIFGVAAVGGSLQGEVTLTGPLETLRGSLELHGRDLRYRTGAVDSLLLVARSGPDGWRLYNLEAVHGEDRLSGRGGIAMNPVMFKDMALDLTLRDFHPYLGWFLAGDLPAAGGRLDAHLEFSGSPAAPEGSFNAILTDATIGSVDVARGELTGKLGGEIIEVTSLEALTSEGRMALTGSLQHRAWGLPVTAAISRLSLGRDDLSLELLEPFAARMAGENSWSFEAATLQGEAGIFRLAGGASPQAGYDIAFRLGEVRSEPLRTFFGDLPLEFRGLNLEGRITGVLPAPEITLSGSVGELRAHDGFVPLAGQLDLQLSPRGIVFRKFSLTTAAGGLVTLAGTVPYDPFARRFIPAKLGLEGLFSVPDLGVFTAFLPEGLRMVGTLAGTLLISGTGEHPEAAVELHGTDVRFPAIVSVTLPGPLKVDAAAIFKDNDLRIESLTASGGDLNLSVSGDWRGVGDLLNRSPQAAGLPGSLALNGAFSIADAGWLGRRFSVVRRLGGKLAGTVAVSGPTAKPDITAELSLTDGEFRADGTMPPLRDIQAHLSFARRIATIDRFTGSVGGSPFAVEGTVVMPLAGRPEADLRVNGANILLYRSEGVGVRADADITVRGPLSAPAFSGTVAITDGRIRKNINWLEPLRDIVRSKQSGPGAGGAGGIGVSFPNPPLKDATFAIHVINKNPFRVKGNVARGELRADLWLKGTGEIPVITGVIYIDNSRVMLPAGRLSVDSGLIRFPEKSPDRPLLEISGSSRIRGYDINVSVEGPYDEPVVTLSSVPPLPQDALLLLILTGKLPAGVAEQAGGWQGGMSVALYMSRGVIDEWFGTNDLDAEESMLDRLDLIIGRGISRQGNETIGAQFLLADGVFRDGDHLYLVAERDIYDESNAGIRIVFQFK